MVFAISLFCLSSKICGWAAIARGVQKRTRYVCMYAAFSPATLMVVYFSKWWVAVLSDMFVNMLCVCISQCLYMCADRFSIGNSKYVYEIKHYQTQFLYVEIDIVSIYNICHIMCHIFMFTYYIIFWWFTTCM